MSYEIRYRAQAFGASVLLFILIIGFNLTGLSVMSLLLCGAYAGLCYNLKRDVHWLEILENYWSKLGTLFTFAFFFVFMISGGNVLVGLTFATGLLFLIGFGLLITWSYLPVKFTHKRKLRRKV